MLARSPEALFAANPKAIGSGRLRTHAARTQVTPDGRFNTPDWPTHTFPARCSDRKQVILRIDPADYFVPQK